jgi:hypothetical protein
MNAEVAVAIVEQILSPRSLSYVQKLVFSQSWDGKTYKEIATATGYDSDYVKEVGSQLWGLLSESLGERVTKKNIPLLLQQFVASQSVGSQSPPPGPDVSSPPVVIPFPLERVTTAAKLTSETAPAIVTTRPLETQNLAWLPEALPSRRVLETALHEHWQILVRDSLTLGEMGLPLASLSFVLLTLVDAQPNTASLQKPHPQQQVALLQQLLPQWQNLFKRPGDCIGRYDTATLGIVLPQTHPKGALYLMEQIRQQLQELRNQLPQLATISLASGVATIIPRRSKQLETLQLTAEAALAEARQPGRDYILYKPCLD